MFGSSTSARSEGGCGSFGSPPVCNEGAASGCGRPPAHSGSGIANWSTLSDCLAMFCKGVGTECLEESMHSPSFTSSDSCKKLETMSVQRIVKAMQSRNCIVQSLMPKNTFLVIFHGKINSSASFNFRIILSLRNFIELIPPSCQLRFCCLKRER